MSTEMSQSSIEAPVGTQSHNDDFWVTDPERFDFDLDYDYVTNAEIKVFENKQLWHQTCLQLITAKENESKFLNVQNSFLYENDAMALNPSKADQEGNVNTFELFSISHLLEKGEDHRQLREEEQSRLRVSRTVLRHLASTYRIPSAFLASVARPKDICGTAFRRQSQHQWDYWCLFPFRVYGMLPVEQGQSMPRRNQMNPSNKYIYFEGQRIGIYGCMVSLYIQGDSKTRKTRVFVVHEGIGYHHGHQRVRAPLAQVQKSLKQRCSSVDSEPSPCFVLLIYIAHILRWWISVLWLFNKELIGHEIHLQEEIANETEGFINTSKVLNAALHTMAAHLHRYKTELQRVDLVLSDLRKYREYMTYRPKPRPSDREESGKKEDDDDGFPPIDRELQKIEQLASQLAATSSFSDEMERKVQNILALLFNQIQAINDKTLQAILNTSQQETRISQRLSLASHMLSRSMKRDSIAMKTIAIMTLVFLPGATFAAIFAMPFFTENKHLSSPSQVWVWVILTAICTTFAFGGYIHLVKRGEMTLGDPEHDSDAAALSDGATTSNASSAVGNGGNTSSSGNKRHWWQRVSRRTSQSSIELSSRRRS